MNFRWLRGASVIVPILIIVFGVTLYFLARKNGPDDQLNTDMIPYIALSGLALFLCLVAMMFFIVFDIIQIAKRRSFSGVAKAGWICAVLFLSIIAVPVYGLTYFKEPS